MLLPIAQALPYALLRECQLTGGQNSLFSDGGSTAGWHARERKHNLQARPAGDSTRLNNLVSRVESTLLKHELLLAAARPKAIIRLMLSRYDETMRYDNHVDNALMDGQRTDLSFTVFLTPPEDYDGGELVIEDASAERPFKLKAGDMLLYPSTTLHRVEPVSRGSRLVLVGWIRSFIRSAERREVLFDLERSIALLRSKSEQSAEELDLILKTRSNLLRLWAED